MAVTIVRSVWIDDDGTGTTGTVINQALHTTLYNEIDTALAKVAQLAGGNTFTGTQTVNGVLVVTNGAAERFRVLATGEVGIGYATSVAGNMLSIAGDASASRLGIAIVNASVAVTTMSYLTFYNGSFGVAGAISQNSATTVVYNTSSDGRLKDDGGRATDLTALRAIVIHDFTWKADGVRARGVFAQEAAAVFPAATTEGTDELTDDGSLAHPWMTDYSKFVPDLIVGWQQHDAELAELRALLSATVKG